MGKEEAAKQKEEEDAKNKEDGAAAKEGEAAADQKKDEAEEKKDETATTDVEMKAEDTKEEAKADDKTDEKKEEVKEEEVKKEEEAEEEDEEMSAGPPKAALTEEELKTNFIKPTSRKDLLDWTLNASFGQFSIPEKAEGFDEVKYEWDDAAKSKQYLKTWVLERKITSRLEGIQPGE